jgi:thiol:disulfide interchange protein
MRKALSTTILFLFLFSGLFAQMESHVSWQYSTKRTSDNEAELILKAKVDAGWHLYSQFFPDGGPIRLEFKFEKSPAYELIGKVGETPAPKEVLDKVFDIKVKYFEKNATFTQKIKLISGKPFTIKGSLSGQICMEDGACMMVNEDFEFNLEGAKAAATVENPVETGSSKSGVASANIQTDSLKKKNNADTLISKAQVPTSSDASLDANIGLWLFFWVSFLSGLLAILTPCVFPMIPMTVSFFMHGGQSKLKAKFDAIYYGLSIIFIYTVVGTIVAFTFGPNIANFLSTHWVPNIFFFLIFLIFAASFFGMFEIVLPSWLVNKADKQVDKGGIGGPFFMAFTLVLVSFSCTGPIVGAVLVQSAGGQFLKPIVGMLGFSMAFAVPFTLFALFPSWLSKLPKSGGWLNTVKVVLGFIELALGLKFLSMADLAYNWHILDREVFLAFWIVIFFLLGVYLLGKLKFAHDDEMKHLGVPRLILAIITFTFVVYMIPGLWGAPLKALSGYLPPMTTQDFNIEKTIRENAGAYGVPAKVDSVDAPKYADKLHIEHGIKGYFEWNQALKVAKKLGKPVFVDFTGKGCANCRKMEENVWVDPRVLKSLKEDFVVLSLYVDFKIDADEEDWIKLPNGKVKKTIGDINSYIQETKFKANSQPHYVILDTEGKQIAGPRFFNLNKDEFVGFLKAGVAEFKKKSASAN